MWWRWSGDERCCGLFQDGLENQGQAGLSIVPVIYRETNRRSFRMEFWAVPKAESENGSLVLNNQDRPIVLGTQQTIQFCPFCGKNLIWFYRLNFDSLPGLLIEEPVKQV